MLEGKIALMADELALDPEPSTLDPEPSALDPELTALCPEFGGEVKDLEADIDDDWTCNYFSSSIFFKFSTKYSYNGWMSKCPAIIVDISKLIQALTMFWFEEIIDFDRISPDT